MLEELAKVSVILGLEVIEGIDVSLSVDVVVEEAEGLVDVVSL